MACQLRCSLIFCRLGEALTDTIAQDRWAWARGDYALGRLSGDQGWILAVEREAEGIDQLDRMATELGYSVVPVAMEDAPSDESVL